MGRGMRIRVLSNSLVLFFAAALSASATTYYVTISGLGGEPDYVQRFKMWADDIHGSLKKSGCDTNFSTLVAPTRDKIRARMAELASQAKPSDSVVLLLIGHGT